jgi:hypothetical protein
MGFLKNNWFKIVIAFCIIVVTVIYVYLSMLNHNKVVWHQAVEECDEKSDMYIKGCLMVEDKFYIGNIFRNVIKYCDNRVYKLDMTAFEEGKFNLCSKRMLPDLPELSE